MAEEMQQRSKPPIPKYFQYDQIQKEEFLSQLGNYTQEQRSLFRKICDFWEPELSFDRFISQEKDGFSFLDSHLRFLMNRLSSSRCGLLQMKIEKSQLVPDRIILTEPDSIRYFYYMLENEYLQILVQDEKSFIDNEYLLEVGLTIPTEYIEDISHTEISNEYLNTEKNNIRILRVTMEGARSFFCTPYTIQHVIRIARSNVRLFLSNSQVITLVAKIMGTMNSEIQKSLGSTDTVFWNKLTSTMLEHRSDILEKRKNSSANVFDNISLLYAYTRNAIDETERIRQENKAKKDEMIEVCKKIYERSEPFLDQTEINTYLENGLKRWEDFKELFFDKCVRLKTKTGLPIIVNIGTGYIHRDHLYLTFKAELEIASSELQDYYRKEMEAMLLSRRKVGVNCFSSQAIFQTNIFEQIHSEHKVLGALLQKPKLVSEGIIHYGKKALALQTPDQIRQLLDKYFEEESTLRFKRIDHLLDLYLLRIYQEAYQKLSLFRRLIMKIFGRHESYTSIFSGKSGIADRRTHPRTKDGTYRASDIDMREDVRQANLSNEDYVPPGDRAARSTSPPPRRRRTPSGSSDHKNYSYRQRTKAWKEFEDLVNKKD